MLAQLTKPISDLGQATIGGDCARHNERQTAYNGQNIGKSLPRKQHIWRSVMIDSGSDWTMKCRQ